MKINNVLLILTLLFILGIGSVSVYANVIDPNSIRMTPYPSSVRIIPPHNVNSTYTPPKKDFNKMTLDEKYYEIWNTVDNPWKVKPAKRKIYADVLRKMKVKRQKELKQLQSNTQTQQLQTSQQMQTTQQVQGISIGAEARRIKLESINNDLKFINKTLKVFEQQKKSGSKLKSMEKPDKKKSEQGVYLYTLAAISFAIMGIICVMVVRKYRK